MPRLRSILVTLLVLAVASVCVRLGFWQLSRLHEKQALNAAQAAALAAPPLMLGDSMPSESLVHGRVVEVRGVYDSTHAVLLAGRVHNGAPGVDVVTPLMIGGRALLVDRGWMYADDGMTARPQRANERGEVVVRGLAEPLRHGAGGFPMTLLPGDSLVRLSARWLDRDSMSARLPYPIADFYLRQLPGPGVPADPVRQPPRPLDTTIHLSYSIQWFTFAAILLGGSLFLARSRRRAPPEGAPEADR